MDSHLYASVGMVRLRQHPGMPAVPIATVVFIHDFQARLAKTGAPLGWQAGPRAKKTPLGSL
jgi:hypothetical protein